MNVTNDDIIIMTYTDHFLYGLKEFLFWSRWLLGLAAILTIADFKFGIDASRYRKEAIRKSRAVKRTMNKVCSYLLWIVVAYSFGEAFGKPFGIDLLPITILLIIYGVELESIFSNYFESKGKKVKVNILRFFNKKTDIIEFEENENKDGNETNE